MAVETQIRSLDDARTLQVRAWVWNVLIVLVCGSALALFARIAIPLPFTPVPITGQTLGVLLIGACLGSRRGGLAMLTYLAEGLVGLPVFAAGTSAWSVSSAGIPIILGPNAGYLVAFPFAAFVVGWLAEHGWLRHVGFAFLAMLLGNLVIYLLGVGWLAHFVGPVQAMLLGVLPFIPGDVLKIAIAAAVLPAATRLLAPTFTRLSH